MLRNRYVILFSLVGVMLLFFVVAAMRTSQPSCRPGESLVRSEDDGLVCVVGRAP